MKRGDFLKTGLGGLAGFYLGAPALAAAASEEDPHFFLHLYIYGGLDTLFLFDGRPKSMTAAGFIHDYVKEDPTVWKGANGTNCRVTQLARRLEKHRQRFSVINGVLMATSFDGHPQNVNFLFTGNPFGGESFVPHLNERQDSTYHKRPLDALQSGNFPLDQTNGGATVPLSVSSARQLIETVRGSRAINPRFTAVEHLRRRYELLGRGNGRFSLGARAMGLGYASAPDLADRLTRVKLHEQPDPESSFIDLMSGFFRERVAAAAILQLVPDKEHFDVHSGLGARKQTVAYVSVMDKLLRVFDLLAATPFDSKRTLFDVTTVMVSSEFGRALRQPGLALDETGTDHNVLGNSILLGGKGIRGGYVIGETDFQSEHEELSPAHLTVDPQKLKLMGRPFDFQTGQSRADKPAAFDLDDYITMSSVVNTIHSCMGVPQAKWRTVKRDGPKAPVLASLL